MCRMLPYYIVLPVREHIPETIYEALLEHCKALVHIFKSK